MKSTRIFVESSLVSCVHVQYPTDINYSTGFPPDWNVGESLLKLSEQGKPGNFFVSPNSQGIFSKLLKMVGNLCSGNLF